MKPDPKPGGKAHKVIWGGTLTSFSNNYNTDGKNGCIDFHSILKMR